MERNHYQSSKTTVIVSPTLRKNRPNNFSLFKNLVILGRLTNSLAGRQRLEKDLLPSVLPEVGSRTTSTVGLSDMVTRESQANKLKRDGLVI